MSQTPLSLVIKGMPRITGGAGTPWGDKPRSQVSALVQLSVQMRVIRRDNNMPEEEKRRQLELLRQQAAAIQESRKNKDEKDEHAVLTQPVAAAPAAASAPASPQGTDPDITPGDAATSNIDTSAVRAEPEPAPVYAVSSVATPGTVIDVMA
jgi:hypothetical protein